MKAPRITYQVLRAVEMSGVGNAPGRTLRKGETITLTLVRQEALQHVVQLGNSVYSLPTYALPWLREVKR